MSYEIIYTKEAEQDTVDILEYISNNLLAPDTARKQVGRIINAIDGLDEMPQRHKVYKDEPWCSKGIRVLPVDNYLVFYLVMKKESKVAIIRIMYSRRDFKD